MSVLRHSPAATPDAVREELRRAVRRLRSLLRREIGALKELQRVRDLLESLPLASDEYATATNRLRNAHRYLVSEERGAARYELQLLAGSLTK